MRIQMKKMIVETIETMIEGLEYSKECNNESAFSMIDQCYDGIVSVENVLKKELSEMAFEKYVDKFCKMRDFHINIKNYLENNEIFYKEIEKSIDILKQLIFDLNNEEEVKIEILFMPYKISMWDSLEPIYRVAQKDKRCNAYVMPIPYYVLSNNEEGKYLEYEGDKFDEKVNIVDFRNYIISEKRPDIIYIHNPYDQYNSLTRIPEVYYSREIKKYTKMLIYSPYYVWDEFIKGKDEIYYVCPSTSLYADKYISMNSKEEKVLLSLGLNSEKVMAFGSPKIDSIVYNTNNNCKIPDEWLKKVKGKKVFLLNTKIFHFSGNAENALVELERLINSFIEDKRITLIWRPHPLALDGVIKYYPIIFERYLELINNVKSAENCIYDDTSEYYKSFALSDALISDKSSITLLYSVTKKPIYYLEDNKDRTENEVVNYISDYNKYSLSNGVSLEEFKEMVLKNEDIYYDERVGALQEDFPNIDGKASEHIHNKICEELLDII